MSELYTIFAKFRDLFDHLPVLQEADIVLYKVYRAIKELDVSGDSKYDHQSFYFAGEQFFLKETDWEKIDIVLKDCLRETDLRHKSMAIDKDFNRELSTCLDQVLQQATDNHTDLAKLLLLVAPRKLMEEQPNIDAALFHRTVTLVLSNEVKEAYLKNTSQDTILSYNKLTTALGNALLIAYTEKINSKFLSDLDFVFSEYTSLTLLLKDSKSKAFSKRFKAYPPEQDLIRLLTHYYCLKLLLHIKRNVDNTEALRKTSLDSIINNYNVDFEMHITTDMESCRSFVNAWARLVGGVIVDALIKHKLFSLRYNKRAKGVTPINLWLLFEVSRYLCRFAKESNKEATLNVTNNLFAVLNKRKSLIQTNNPAILTRHKFHKNRRKMQDIRYTINLNFLSDFLSHLLALLKSSTLEIYNNDDSLKFLSAIYDINFLDLFKNINTTEQKEYLVEFLKHITDFTVRTKFSREVDSCKVFSQTLNNRCLNKKFLFNEFLFQLFISVHFNYFYQTWYYDYRGRSYSMESIITPYLPFSRTFLSFFKVKPRLNEEINQENKKLLMEQLLTYVEKPNPCRFSYNIKDVLKNTAIKFNNIFNYINLCNDYKNYDQQVAATSFYSLDARNSGFQIMALYTKNRFLAQNAKLLPQESTEDIDLYTSAKQHVFSYILRLKDFFFTVKATYPTFIHGLSKFSAAYNKHMAAYHESNKNPATLTLKPYIKPSRDTILHTKLSFVSNYLTEQQPALTMDVYEDLFETLKQENLLNFLLSKKILKVIMDEYEDDTTQLVVFLSYYKLMKIYSCLRNKHIYNHLDRNIVKRPIMTVFYGATFQGKSEQIVEAYIDKFLTEGIFMTSYTFRQVMFFSNVITSILSPWVDEKFKPAMKFFHIVKSMANKQTFRNFKVKTSNFSFHYRPRIMIMRQIRLGKQRCRIAITTPSTDFRKLARCFVANCIQLGDSTICYYFTRSLTSSVPFFTIHDRFFISPYYAHILKNVIAKAYLELYGLNFISLNFKDTPIMDILAEGPDSFTAEELAKGLETCIFVKP